ncbi:MAG: radical SAM protein [Candidatus Aenigmarchaeota archaeon]|nr:radical SAM protein [Candidatus Aenigmarchaeota archaeon]
MVREISKFNVIVPEGQEDYHELVYNTFTGSITRVNHPLAEVLKNRSSSVFKFPEFRLLSECLENQGILIQPDFDELKEYEKMHQRWKEGRENVEVNALLTYDCNFECPYCYQGRGEDGYKIHGYKYMSPELLGLTTDFIKRTLVERGARKIELVLYGGEPFLPVAKQMGRKLADDISRWTEENDVSFSLHVLSNGSLMSDDDIEWLSGYKARLQIPIDGSPEMHDKYRFYKENRKGSFENVARVLSLTKGSGIETHIRISLTDETYPTMENLLGELRLRGLNHVYPDFCYITAFTEACSDFESHTLSDLQLFKIMPELWRKAHANGFPLDIRPRVQPLPCSSVADGSYLIDPFGEVYKCWELVGLKEHSVGRIK